GRRDLGRELLPGRDRRLPTGLPERGGVPEEVRVLGRAGVPPAGFGADRGSGVGRGGHPERLLFAVPADGDLRLRRAAEQGRARVGGPRVGREEQLTMPTYVFTCAICGRFEESRPMALAGEATT